MPLIHGWKIVSDARRGNIYLGESDESILIKEQGADLALIEPAAENIKIEMSSKGLILINVEKKEITIRQQ